MIKYPFLELDKINSQYSDEMKCAANRIIDSGRYLHGNEVKMFETELARSCNTEGAVAVSNGLDALRLILKAYIELGYLKSGDEIIVQANTYIASILAITDNNLCPVLVEPDTSTLNINSDLIEQHITSRTRAIMVVHLYGTPCWNEQIKSIAQRNNLLVIEDNAQAIGAKASTSGLSGTSYITGGLGSAGAFSFYPTKNIGALGDAGAVTSNNKQLLSAIKALANYGSDYRYHNIYTGYNCRMDELQAAFLRIKLRHLDNESHHRQKIAAIYNTQINNPLIAKPVIFSNMQQVWHQYTIRCSQRTRLIEHLGNNSVATDIHYATPPHLQPCYSKTLKHNPLPLTELIANEILSLPIASTSETQACEIAEFINNFNN